METFLESIKPYFSGYPVWVTAIAVVCVAIWKFWLQREWILFGTPGNPSFEKRIALLKRETFPNAYRKLLVSLLGWMRRWFGGEAPAKPGSWMDRVFQVQPWTVLSFERLMLLAFIYPLLFLLLGWLFGYRGQLGPLALVRPSAIQDRIIFFPSFGFVFFTVFRTSRSNRLKSWLWWNSVAVVFIGAFDNVLDVTGDDALAGAVGVAVAVAVAVSLAILSLRNRAASNSRFAAFWVIVWLFLLLYVAAFGLAITIWGDREKVNDGFTLLLFLGVLPLFNAPLDWLSFGFTRGLLRSIENPEHGWKHAVACTVADVVFAVIFLILVAGSSLLGLALMNSLAISAGSQAVIDTAILWQQITEDGYGDFDNLSRIHHYLTAPHQNLFSPQPMLTL